MTRILLSWDTRLLQHLQEVARKVAPHDAVRHSGGDACVHRGSRSQDALNALVETAPQSRHCLPLLARQLQPFCHLNRATTARYIQRSQIHLHHSPSLVSQQRPIVQDSRPADSSIWLLQVDQRPMRSVRCQMWRPVPRVSHSACESLQDHLQPGGGCAGIRRRVRGLQAPARQEALHAAHICNGRPAQRNPCLPPLVILPIGAFPSSRFKA